MIKKSLEQRIEELSERQLKDVLLDISTRYKDVVSVAVHYAEKYKNEENDRKGVLYR